MDIDSVRMRERALHPMLLAPPHIPARAGVGLRVPHYTDFLERSAAIDWVEVHTENLFVPGGAIHRAVGEVRRDYPLSLHGVSLSLGSGDPLSNEHLRKVRELVRRYEPGLVSDHVCWVSAGGRYLHDLLPVPYTEDMLCYMADRVMQTQEFLQRQILVENPSAYLQFTEDQMPEWERRGFRYAPLPNQWPQTAAGNPCSAALAGPRRRARECRGAQAAWGVKRVPASSRYRCPLQTSSADLFNDTAG